MTDPWRQGSDHAPVYVTLKPGTLIRDLRASKETAAGREGGAAAAGHTPPLASSVIFTARQGRLDALLANPAPTAAAQAHQQHADGKACAEDAGFATTGGGGARLGSGQGGGAGGGGGGGSTSRHKRGADAACLAARGRSIRSFFQPKAPAVAAADGPSTAVASQAGVCGASVATKLLSHSLASGQPTMTKNERGAEEAGGRPLSPDDGDDESGDGKGGGGGATDAVSEWQRIQQRMAPPRCRGHGEVCKVREVKKEGPNRGRVFFCCPRPAGQRGNKEADCGHFEWAYSRK